MFQYDLYHIIWVPEHDGIEGNGKPDEFARQGATQQPFIGLESALGLSKCYTQKDILSCGQMKNIELYGRTETFASKHLYFFLNGVKMESQIRNFLKKIFQYLLDIAN